MDIKELVKTSEGILLNPSANLNRQIKGAFAADLMSDVLASIQPDAVLLTGLCNPQVIRTAVMADVAAVVVVRGKTLPEATVNLAITEDIPLIKTNKGMFEMCGLLYNQGLMSMEKPLPNGECSENACDPLS
jgi:predicted transcriptional regulator